MMPARTLAIGRAALTSLAICRAALTSLAIGLAFLTSLAATSPARAAGQFAAAPETAVATAPETAVAAGPETAVAAGPETVVAEGPETAVAAAPAAASAASSDAPAAASKPGITAKDTLTVKELARRLAGPEKARPLLIHMGFGRLYRAGHIPGSRYVGAASTPEGLAGLRRAVKGERHDRDIVLYCGCCPWTDCPNVLPALRELRRLGFRNVRALYIPKDFWTDWVDLGHPVAKGD